MRIRQQPGGSLLVLENPAWLQALLVGFGVAIVAGVATQEPRDDTRVLFGALAALLPVGGAALLERVRFEFDIAQRRLRWQRKRLFRRLSGELAFADISGVTVRVRHERDFERRRQPDVPWYYVVLATAAGDLRLSDRMYADGAGPQEVADAIRAALGQPLAVSAEPAPESIEQLAAAGEVIEAVKLARRLHGLDLTEAKQLVDRLRDQLAR